MNRLIHGDCLEAMSGLERDVRLAYLDPPFNTGERFADYDDARDRDEWLSWLSARVQAAWGLLRDDGSLWLHCDDAEQAAVRVRVDAALGRAAFVATVVWQKRYSRENRLAFSPAHDYLHVYAPAGGAWKRHRNRLPREDPPGTWRAGDERGPWSTVSLVAQGGHGTRAQFYAIALPSGRAVEPPAGSCWRVTRERFAALVADDLVWFGAGGDNVPRRKVFLSDAQGLVPSTWWPHTEAGHNAEANAELRRLFPGERPFATPKPERLMARIIGIATDPGDLVLDPFLGSGTTAAVAGEMGRRWIGIESSAATIERYAAPRLSTAPESRAPRGPAPAASR
jgi:adenine-specific DNA-methyltransferase